MALYDPDRSRVIRGQQPVAGWAEFFGELLGQTEKAKSGAAPLHILTSTVSSPSLLRQIEELSTRMPDTRWFAYDPRQGRRISPQRFIPHLDTAKVIVSLDADPLGPGPMQIVAWPPLRRWQAAGRTRACRGSMPSNPTWTLTGANADHRLPLAPAGIEAVAKEIAARARRRRRGVHPVIPEEARPFVEAMLADLHWQGKAAPCCWRAIRLPLKRETRSKGPTGQSAHRWTGLNNPAEGRAPDDFDASPR